MGLKMNVQDNSAAFLNAKNQGVAKALEIIGLKAENYAKILCPVDTGRLRNSITHRREGEAEVIGTNVEYAPYVEMGTQRTKAQPYLWPAAKNHASEYREIIISCLRNA